MKKYLFSLFLLAGLSGSARAEGVFDIGYTTTAVTGVTCTTGTVSGVPTQLNATRPTGWKGKVAAYRIQSQDSTYAVWIGGVSVSSSAVTNLGEMLGPGSPGDSGVWPAGYDGARDALVPLYCKAADGAAGNGVKISVSWWGY